MDTTSLRLLSDSRRLCHEGTESMQALHVCIEIGLAEGFMLFQVREKVSEYMEPGREDEDGEEESED